MYENIQSIEQYHYFINSNSLAVIHVMRNHCSVCHAVLPQIQDLLEEYPKVKFGVINRLEVENIAGELSIFTVPVELIFVNGKEMHRQGRFIDMQIFERQLNKVYDAVE